MHMAVFLPAAKPSCPITFFLWGGICGYLTRFLFGVGSVAPIPDFSLGLDDWDPIKLYGTGKSLLKSFQSSFSRRGSLNKVCSWFVLEKGKEGNGTQISTQRSKVLKKVLFGGK